MAEVTAVIRHVGIGTRGDPGGPVLWFDAYVSEASVALQIIPWGRGARGPGAGQQHPRAGRPRLLG